MKNYRTWGKPPYKVAVVHGGPGLPGSVAPIARELSKDTGVIEVLETKDSVEGQIEELAGVLKEHADFPVILVGHSWGAVLSYMTAARYPTLVKKLIIIGMPALEMKDRPDYTPIWLSRLPEKERVEFLSLEKSVWDGEEGDKSEDMGILHRLTAKADSYAFVSEKDEVLEYQFGINKSVGTEFHEILKTTELLDIGGKIKCPVVAIHGDYDLRLASVMADPLSDIIKDFKLVLLEKCGHYPWMEKFARDKFYEVLRKEL